MQTFLHVGCGPKLKSQTTLSMLNSGQQLVIAAARALGRLGTVDAAKPLAGLLRDPRPTVRKAAVEALGEVPL